MLWCCPHWLHTVSISSRLYVFLSFSFFLFILALCHLFFLVSLFILSLLVSLIFFMSTIIFFCHFSYFLHSKVNFFRFSPDSFFSLFCLSLMLLSFFYSFHVSLLFLFIFSLFSIALSCGSSSRDGDSNTVLYIKVGSGKKQNVCTDFQN